MSRHYTSALSTLFGRFASKEFPAIIQHIINAGYVKMMGLDMGEFRAPSSYKTLNKLFTRAIELPRKLPEDRSKLISGVDALITDYGTITEGRAYQIKGMSYDIRSL
ncbi:MAG: phosphatidylserine decarboxylase, partial [Sulfurovum sp.]|nr:phosphatidylserine decarboxylase [Sulfurovum sp.]